MGNSSQLSQLFVEMMKSYGLRDRYLEARLRLEWPKMLDRAVSKEITQLHLREATLYLQISSSVLRFQLSAQKEALIARCNQQLGLQVVKDIVLC